MRALLLITDYSPDRQWSMRRFGELFADGLRQSGVLVECCSPPVLFGKLPVSSTPRKWLGYVDKFLIFPAILLWRARRYDFVHVVDHSNAMYAFWLRGKTVTVTCHDLLAVRAARGEFPSHHVGRTGRILQKWILAGLKRMDFIFCDSAATREDGMRLLERSDQSFQQVAPGLAPAFADALAAPQPPSKDRKSPLDVRYILHVGGLAWYKNRTGLLAIYRALREILGLGCPELWIVGEDDRSAATSVRYRQARDDSELRDLYRYAELLLFPSLAEGFGWPIIEAQACGCPVVTTGSAPMNETGGSGAIYLANLHEVKRNAETVAEFLLRSEEGKDQIRAAGFRNAARFRVSGMVDSYLERLSKLP